MHQWPVLAPADEIEDDPDKRIARKLTLDPRKPLTEDTGPQEQGAISVAQAANVVARQAAPTHPDHSEPVEHGTLANRKAKWDDVGTDTAHA
jgi:hypothetical protein